MQYSNQLSSLANALQQSITQTVSSLPDVDTLRAQLTTRVDQSVSSGRLNSSSAATLKAELQHVADIESAYKTETGGSLSPRQIELLSDELNKARADIDQQIKLSDSAAPALDDKRRSIESKIDADVTAGRLPGPDAVIFKKQLAQIATEQSSYVTGGGMLTGNQVLHIAQELDAVDQAVSGRLVAQLPPQVMPGAVPPTVAVPVPVAVPAQIQSIDPRVTRELDEGLEHMRHRLQNAIQSGQVSAEAAAGLTHQLDEIRMEEDRFKSSPGGVNAAQVDELHGRLLHLDKRLDEAVAASVQAAPPTDGNLQTNIGNSTSVGNLPIVNTKPLTDIRGFWGEQYISELSARGVIGGFPDGSFKPNDEITRAQFAAIVAHALNLSPMPQAANFSDVSPKYWAAGVIGSSVNAGLITGYPDGTYKPADKITRAQALVILSKALRGGRLNPAALNSYSDANSIPRWAQKNLAMAASSGIIVSFPDPAQIRPNDNATRGDVAALMYQTLNALGANLPPLRIGVLAQR
ncbi:MAG TPA: S-layer homology domain-containing protein [Candidatus Obscuribacterales bacterium]